MAWRILCGLVCLAEVAIWSPLFQLPFDRLAKIVCAVFGVAAVLFLTEALRNRQ